MSRCWLPSFDLLVKVLGLLAAMLPVQKLPRPATDTHDTKRKRWLACNYCREKKVRCKYGKSQNLALRSKQKDLGDGRNPCSYCEKHDQRCETPAKRRPKDNSLDAEATSRRLARLEAMLQNSIDKSPNTLNPQVTARLDQQSLTNGENVSSQFLVPSILYPSQPIPDRNIEPTLVTTSLLNRGDDHSDLPQHQGTAF